MKTVWLRAVLLVIFACGLTVAFDAKLQVRPGPDLNQRIIVIPVGGVDFKLKKEVVEKTRVAKPPFKPEVVTSLVRHYRLDKKSKINPELVFGPEEISNWKNKNLDRETLRLEFAARKLILDAADDQKVKIRDQEMLSIAARAVIPYLQDSPKSASVSSEPPREQQVDLPNVICGSKQDDTSEILIRMAWDAFNANKGGMAHKNFEKALACAKVAIDRFSPDADEQQAARLQASECKKTPKPTDKDAYFASYWALSDVSAAWFIRGQVFEQQSNCKDAREAYQLIIAKYNCAYIWDPKGWFWNAARGADEGIKRVQAMKCT
jgi:hypothetical protein